MLQKKIDSLNMNIFSNKGEKIYSITSPYSSYDNKKLEFQLKNTIPLEFVKNRFL